MPNKLLNEQSLYLQQHAHNPVDWYPWGDEAFEVARMENKPLIISIGYAACHWCHVMERESFEDSETAAYMNAHFINVKVDREEHPDVDQMYMDAVQAISGNGGWPLNVFVTADRIPFYGGTYYPPKPAYSRPSWMQLMQRMNEVWMKQPDEIKMQSEQMVAFLKNASDIGFKSTGERWDSATCDEMAESLLKHADRIDGGFGNAPKFPHTMAIQFLMEHYHYSGNDKSLKQALLSLDKMMEGGIYDQLGGGFARYSTDAGWLAPHFEKMLYDNALLINVYCTALRITDDEKYKRVIVETIDFVERELKDESGIYYSALDADSEGEEGKFYTWTWKEWDDVINGNGALLRLYFDVTEEGNWEGTNILHTPQSVMTLVEGHHQNAANLLLQIQKSKEQLMNMRDKRIRPLTDDKSLLSWNALMNIALVNASIALDDKTYLTRAIDHMRLMLEYFEKQDRLFHVWKNGKSRIDATFEDYATLIQALLQLASLSGDTGYILKANDYCETVIENFQQEAGVFFYYTSIHSKNIPIRKVDIYDGAQPSANSLMAHNLSILGLCMSRTDWMKQSEIMQGHLLNATTKHALSFSYWAMLQQRNVAGLKTIIVAGKDAEELKNEMDKVLLPHGYVMSTKQENNDVPILEEKYSHHHTHIFVCSQDACFSPVANVADALKTV